MKKTTFFVLSLVVSAVIIAGCASTQPAQPAPATLSPTELVTIPDTPAAPTQLAGSSWIVTSMGIQDGTAVIRPDSAEITLTFSTDGTVSGNGGCNNYNGPFTLSGEATPKGKGISIGPLVSTKMFCQAYSEQETTYLNILQKAMAYTMDGNQLSITATTGDVLIYQTPASIVAQV